MNIGLFFGSFNPIHIGHLIIADSAAQMDELDQVWFVVSPQSPHKKKHSLLPDWRRLDLVEIAVRENDRLRACDIEFELPKPSYTIDTLMAMRERWPEHRFTLVMGEDNILNVAKWKNGDIILRDYPILVYGRAVHAPAWPSGQISKINGPLLNISASIVRERIHNGKDIRYLVSDPVLDEIQRAGDFMHH